MKKPAYLLAFLFLLAADSVFFSPALFSSRVRAPADVTTHWPAFQADVEGAPPPMHNELLNDWLVQFHPWQHLVRDSYAQGRVPLWNDKSGCGEPLLAAGQCEALSPYLPLLLASGDQYVDWRQLAQVLVAQIFCLLLAAELSLSAAAAAIVALTYGFSSFMQVWAIHPHSASASFAPGILWALLRTRSAPTAGRLLVAALLVACSLLAGHVETAAKAGLVAGTVAFLFGVLQKPAAGRLRYSLLIGAAGVCGLLLAACLLAPFFDYVDQSPVRELRARYLKAPIPLSQLVTLLDPGALGSALSPATYHGVGSYPDGVLHVGVVGVLLAAAGLVAGLVRRTALTVSLAAVAALGVVIACDPFPQIVSIAALWPEIPGLRDIWPFRFLYCAVLPLALLAGIGFDELARFFHRHSLRTRRVATAVVVLATGLTAALPWHDFLLAGPEAGLHPKSRAMEKLRDRTAAGRSIELGRVLPPGFGPLYGFRQVARYDAVGLRRFSEFFRVYGFPIFNYDRMTFAPPDLLDAASVRWVLSMYPAAEARTPTMPFDVFAGADAVFDLKKVPSIDRGIDLVIFRGDGRVRDGTIEIVFEQSGQEVVWALTADGWKTSSGDAPADAKSAAVVEFVDGQLGAFDREALTVAPALWQASSRATFRVKPGGAPFHVTALFPDGVGKEIVETDDMGWLRISERRTAMPDAYLTPAVLPATSEADASAKVHAGGFDPRARTVVELGGAPDVPEGVPLSQAERARITRLDPGAIDVEVEAAARRLLVVTDAFANGWVARIDGEKTPVYPANLLAKACWVPPGRHVVTMRYEPQSFLIGCVISGATLLLLGVLAAFGYRFRYVPDDTTRMKQSR